MSVRHRPGLGEVFERPRWLLSRLRAMESGELSYRVRQGLLGLRDRVATRASPSSPNLLLRIQVADPGPRTEIRDRFLEAFPTALEAIKEEADDLCAGRVQLFGSRTIDLSTPYTGSFRWFDVGEITAPLGVTAKDTRLVWEVNRHHHWPRLALACFLLGEARYLDAAEQQAMDWIRQNTSPSGPNWRSAMEVSIRAQNWLWSIRFLALSGERGSLLAAKLAAQLPRHADFIAKHRSRYSSANNHAIVEAAGLLVLGQALGGLNGTNELRESAMSSLEQQLSRQVHPDGCSAEQAFHYHVLVLEQLLLVIAQGVPVPPMVRETALRMASFVDDFVVDGDLPTVGDSDDSHIVRLTPQGMGDGELVVLAGHLLEDSRLAPGADWGQDAFWIAGGLIPQPSGAHRNRVPRKTSHYEKGGYHLMRSCDQRTRVLFDHGPLGLGSLAAHGHADCLSILVWRDSKAVIVDSGSYLYSSAHYRQFFRSTLAHNTIAIDSQDQSESLGPFLWGRKATGRLLGSTTSDQVNIVEATHDGFGRWGHRRAVLLLGADILVLSDAVSGPGRATALSSLHFVPGSTLVSGTDTLEVRDVCSVRPLLPPSGRWAVHAAPHAASFLVLGSQPVLRMTIPVQGHTVIHTVIAFGARAEPEVTGSWLRLAHATGTLMIALGAADDGRSRFRGESVFLEHSRSGRCEWAYGRSVQELRLAGEDLTETVVPLSLAWSASATNL